MVTINKKTGSSKKEIAFDRETYDTLNDELNRVIEDGKLSQKVAFASRIGTIDNPNYVSLDIAFFYHDTPIVVWHNDQTVTIDLDGFMGPATQDKLNFALKGHGWVGTAWDGSRSWLLHLIDPNKPLVDNGYGGVKPQYHESVRLFNGLTFSTETGEVLNTEPTVPALDFIKVLKGYRLYGGKSKLPDISQLTEQGVSPVLYDKWLDKLIKLYCENVIVWDYIGGAYNHTRAECHVCDENEEIIDRCLESGELKPGSWGSIKEQALALFRNHEKTLHTDDRNHFLNHVLEAEYNSSIPYIVLTVAGYRPEYWLYQQDDSSLKVIQKHVSRFLRRMLHRSLVNVA